MNFIDYDSDYLSHYGVKGMKWGVRKEELRKNRQQKKIKKSAKRDAKEYARAKMYYGEGAGVRRRHINAIVTQKSKENKNYKKYFDDYLSKQNMDEHAVKAKKERKRTDAKNKTKKTGKGIVHILAGHPEYAASSLVVAYGALRFTGTDKVILDKGKKMANKAASKIRSMKMGWKIFNNPFKGL